MTSDRCALRAGVSEALHPGLHPRPLPQDVQSQGPQGLTHTCQFERPQAKDLAHCEEASFVPGLARSGGDGPSKLPSSLHLPSSRSAARPLGGAGGGACLQVAAQGTGCPAQGGCGGPRTLLCKSTHRRLCSTRLGRSGASGSPDNTLRSRAGGQQGPEGIPHYHLVRTQVTQKPRLVPDATEDGQHARHGGS